MTKKNIIIYATVDWHAKKVAEFCKKNFKKNFEIFFVDDFLWDLENYEKILIISSIRYGKFHKNIRNFIKENYKILNNKKSWFISINLVARKAEKNTVETNIYTKKFFKKNPFKPKKIWVFGWVLDYSKYWFFDRIMIKFIMKLTKWPTSTKEAIDYTNWEKLKIFCEDFDKI